MALRLFTHFVANCVKMIDSEPHDIVAHLTVEELPKQLQKLSLPTDGKKDHLVKRLRKATKHSPATTSKAPKPKYPSDDSKEGEESGMETTRSKKLSKTQMQTKEMEL